MEASIPSDLRDKSHALCSRYLGGKWSEISADQLLLSPLKGGLTNELFVCALPDKSESPHQAVLRLYGKVTCDIPLQLEMVILLASKNLGPKLYGYFDEGRLEEYLPSAQLTSTQMRDPKISATIAKKIASIQHLDVPIPKTKSWLLDMYDEYFSHIKDISIDKFIQPEIPDLTKDRIIQLMSIDFESEIQFLKEIIEKSSSPLVFSNNDLHQNNILLIDESRSKPTLEDRIVLIDFEYASYNFRAFEVANHFAEWRFDYHIAEYPYFIAKESKFPTKSEQRNFVRPYLMQYKLLDQNKLNSNNTNGSAPRVEEEEVDQFLIEMVPFVMASDFLWAIWAIKSAIAAETKYFFWEIAMAKWSFYASFKNRFQKTGNGESKL